MDNNVIYRPWPPFKRSGTTITQRTASDNLDLLAGACHLNDDTSILLGNTLAAPNAYILWETADANANELIFVGPAGGATDVPVFVFGDDTLLDKDLGLFNGVIYPTIAVVDGGATKALYFQHDGTDGIIKTTSGSVSFEDDGYFDTTGVATAGTTTYPSYDFFINGSGWDTDDLVARTTGVRFRWTGSSSGTPGGSLSLTSMSDGVAGNSMLSINSGGTGTFNGNVNSTNGVFGTTTTNLGITLKGNDADDANAAGVILDNGVTLTTAGGKLVSFRNNTVEKAYIDYLGGIYITQGASTTGVANAGLSITGGAHTGITAATEDNGVLLNFSATKTWAAGAGPLAQQREIYIQAPTYNGNAAGALTVTKAATVAISGAPTQGTNITLSNTYALWVQSGTAQFDGGISTTSSTLTSLVIAPTATGNVIDLQLETEWTTGSLINADFAGATTLTGSITGISTDFNSNVTAIANADVYGHQVKMPALTQSTADTVEYFVFNVPTSGALVQNTLAGTIDWRGLNVQLPNTTQTTGTVNSYGVYLAGGTVTSGTQYGLYTTNLTNKFLFGASNVLTIDGATTTHAASTNVLSLTGTWGNVDTSTVAGIVSSVTSGGMTTTGNSIAAYSASITEAVGDQANTAMIAYQAAPPGGVAGSATLIAFGVISGYDKTLATIGSAMVISPVTAGTGNGHDVSIYASDAQGAGPNNGGIVNLYGGAKAGAGNDGYVKIGQGAGTPATITATDDDLYIVGQVEADGLIQADGGLTVLATKMIQGSQGTDLASANDMAVPTSNYCDVTGTTQINTMATTSLQAGTMVVLQFDASVTVKHATAGTGAQFQLSAAGDFAATAGDTLMVVFDGTYWREIARTVI